MNLEDVIKERIDRLEQERIAYLIQHERNIAAYAAAIGELHNVLKSIKAPGEEQKEATE